MNPHDTRLLEALLMARGPGGQEDEVRAVARAELEQHCDEVWVDAAGNLIGKLSAACVTDDGDAIRILAHLDEIAMIVKRVEANGTLRVEALGGAFPFNFGACPVDILGDDETLPGVLSFGTMHTTAESPQGSDVLTGDLQWKDVHISTCLTQEALAASGVRAGTRVVLAQHWRKPFKLGEAIAAHFLDDRGPMLATLMAARQVSATRERLLADVYFVFTTMEEESNAGAMFAAQRLPGDMTIAVEVGPVAAEYGTCLCADPIINTGDEKGYYSRAVTQGLLSAAKRCGYSPQAALLVEFASDASAVMATGIAARAGCIAIPTENTHGYEIMLLAGIEACGQTLAEYVLHQGAGAHYTTR
ncbi:zinc-binding metallopeptidase family protein [Pseudomonas sp. Marseille-QA0892]